MTILEAVVWCFGIMVTGITICSVAKAFTEANSKLRDILESLDEARHERQMEEEKQYERENNSEGS